MGSSIIFRAKSFFIPEQLKQLTLKNNPSGFGVAFVKDGTIDIGTSKVPISPEQLKNLDEQLKNFDVLYSFYDYPDTVPENELHPYTTLVDGAGKVKLVCAVDGDFRGYEAQGTPHVSDFCMHEQVIKPMASRIFRMCKEDLTTFLAEFQQDDIRTQFMQAHIGRGHITFLASDGKIFSFYSGNKEFKEFPWGWCSNNWGYTEDQAPTGAPAPTPAAQPSVLASVMSNIGIPGLSKSSASAPAVPVSKPVATASGPKIPIASTEAIRQPTPSIPVAPPSSVSAASVLIQQPKADNVVSATDADRAALEKQLSEEVVKVPVGLMGKPRKGWFRDNLGHLPSDWREAESGTRSQRMVQKMANRILEKARKEGVAPKFEPAPTAAPKPAIPGTKDVTPHSVQVPQPTLQQAVTAPNSLMPYMSAEGKAKLKTFLERPDILKQISAVPVFWTDKHVDPTKFQAVEKKAPMFWQAAGYDGIHNVVNWDLPMWAAVQAEEPHAVLIALLDFRDELVKAMIMLENVTTPTAKLEPQKPVAPVAAQPSAMSIGIPGMRKAG